jgi:hypothetical protein
MDYFPDKDEIQPIICNKVEMIVCYPSLNIKAPKQDIKHNYVSLFILSELFLSRFHWLALNQAI